MVKCVAVNVCADYSRQNGEHAKSVNLKFIGLRDINDPSCRPWGRGMKYLFLVLFALVWTFYWYGEARFYQREYERKCEECSYLIKESKMQDKYIEKLKREVTAGELRGEE